MRPDSRPVSVTLNLPVLPDEAVIEIRDVLFEILDLFEFHYGHQIQRFIEDNSGDNIVTYTQHAPLDDPPF